MFLFDAFAITAKAYFYNLKVDQNFLCGSNSDERKLGIVYQKNQQINSFFMKARLGLPLRPPPPQKPAAQAIEPKAIFSRVKN